MDNYNKETLCGCRQKLIALKCNIAVTPPKLWIMFAALVVLSPVCHAALSPAAEDNKAFAYAMGQGVTKSYHKALYWYRKAAHQGDAHAEISLSYMYANGDGVPKNYAKAIKWTRKAAAQGSATAEYDMGIAYEKGQGVPRDHHKALYWFRKSANQGYYIAQKALGY